MPQKLVMSFDTPPTETPPRADVAVIAPIDPSTARPRNSGGAVAAVWSRICAVFLRLTRWRIEGDWPPDRKLVVIAAPHTSNMDGVYMLAAAGYFRVKLRWMGKKELTQGPLGGFIRWLGCVPIDRSANNDVVRQMAEEFGAREDLILAVPPEGTRAKTRGWKSGFYHIAREANVPLLLSVLDYGTRTMRLAALVSPSGDYEADFPLIREFYKDAKGLREGDFSVER